MKALLIEWDPSTGKRAGNINPRDANLPCHGWQNMDVTPAVELRLVEDERDISKYECATCPGVTVLIGKDTINATIDANFPSKIAIEDELMYTEHIKSLRGKLNISKLPDDRNDRLRELKDQHHIKGIKEIEPQKV